MLYAGAAYAARAKFIGGRTSTGLSVIPITDELTFHTIEWRKNKNKVYLHKIVDNLDYQFDFDDFDEEVQKEIYLFLVRNFLN